MKFIKIYIGFYLTMNAIINQLEMEAQRRTNEDGDTDNLNWFRGEVIGEFINSHTQEQIYEFLYSYFPEDTNEFTEDVGDELGDDAERNLAYRDLLHNLILESMD
jgi:hypothetical protein